VAPLRLALDLPVRGAVDVVQPHFQLDLADLVMPDCTGLSLQPISAAPLDLLRQWRRDYLRDTGFDAQGDIAQTAEKEIAAYRAAQSHYVLIADGQPVAMTGFNAALPQIVQVGGVYTPPCWRGRGFARRAVALHLAQARAAGVQRAILFAASDAAARAYVALGFERIGDYAIALFDKPQVIRD
jgi:GNAT superfamily N-acetyltransferase